LPEIPHSICHFTVRRVVVCALANIHPQTWAPFAHASVLMTVFCVGTVPKARPSVTPWNKRNGALKVIFPIGSERRAGERTCTNLG
jgi:hypothetical protein